MTTGFKPLHLVRDKMDRAKVTGFEPSGYWIDEPKDNSVKRITSIVEVVDPPIGNRATRRKLAAMEKVKCAKK